MAFYTLVMSQEEEAHAKYHHGIMSFLVHSGPTTQNLSTPFVGVDMQSLSCLHPDRYCHQ